MPRRRTQEDVELDQKLALVRRDLEAAVEELRALYHRAADLGMDEQHAIVHALQLLGGSR